MQIHNVSYFDADPLVNFCVTSQPKHEVFLAVRF